MIGERTSHELQRDDDRRKVEHYDHLHQPGEITQEFADAVRKTERAFIGSNGVGEWWLQPRHREIVLCDITVSSISQVLLILHAYGIEIEWPRKEKP